MTDRERLTLVHDANELRDWAGAGLSDTSAAIAEEEPATESMWDGKHVEGEPDWTRIAAYTGLAERLLTEVLEQAQLHRSLYRGWSGL
jgi:hypothetical protein